MVDSPRSRSLVLITTCAVIFFLGAIEISSLHLDAFTFSLCTKRYHPCLSSAPIVLEGNDAVDLYFQSNGTNGLSPGNAYSMENLDFTFEDHAVFMDIRDSQRYINLTNCTFMLENPTVGTTIAISLQNTSHLYMERCTISCNAGTGMQLSQSSLITVKDCIFVHNTVAMTLSDSCSFITLEESLFLENDEGVTSTGCSDLFLGGNTFRKNNDSVYLANDDYCNLTRNTFHDNQYGLNLGYTSSGNLVWDNYFINNSINGVDANPTNYWDNGTWGNYWSEYEQEHPSAILIDDRFWSESHQFWSYSGGDAVDEHPVNSCSLPFIHVDVSPGQPRVGNQVTFSAFIIHEPGNLEIHWSLESLVEDPGNVTSLSHEFPSAGLHDVSVKAVDGTGDVGRWIPGIGLKVLKSPVVPGFQIPFMFLSIVSVAFLMVVVYLRSFQYGNDRSI
ncbi:hypothetical protein GF325_05750 [Candidatus Bathyarchaeota archaeon]|nr:hypothetical protein [Candidatus Bathyarchaeota archaeon]